MKASFLLMESQTQANKALSYLMDIGVYAKIDRISSPGGCAFGIWVYENPANICIMLAKNGIRCKKTIIRG